MKAKLTLLFISILASVSMFAQNTTVTGTVTESASGYPAIGATVMVKGTTIGTVTDVDGAYTLSGVPSDATLVFASIGFTTVEVSVDGQNVINVSLDTDTQLLEEIVVIGYGTAKSKDEILSQGFIENTLYLDKTLWLVVDGQLPKLR